MARCRAGQQQLGYVLKKATRREEAALVLGRAAEIKRRATARRIPEEARR